MQRQTGRLRLFGAGVVLWLLALAAAAAGAYPVTVVDDAGRELTLAARPRRIVSLAPSATEILFALGAGDRVAGVTSFDDYPPAAVEKPRVGGVSDPSLERVAALAPDLVVASTLLQRELFEPMEGLGLTVAVLDPKTFEEVLRSIEKVGVLVGEESAARELVSGIRARVQRVRDRTGPLPAEERPRVYYEVWHDPIYSVGPGSYIHDLLEIAGGRNVADDAPSPFPILSAEVVIARDPEVILYAHGAVPPPDFARRPGWSGVSAVRSGRVHLLPDENLVNRPGPRVAEGVELLARLLHPDLFGSE